MNKMQGPLIEDLQVFKLAKDLRKHTFIVTTNITVFPKRYIRVIDKIQEHALVIPELIYEANRNKYQRQAIGKETIAHIDKMLSLIDMLYEIDINFGEQKANYWKKMCSDVKFITLAWIYPKNKSR